MTTTQMLWADIEFGSAELGDDRRTRRAVQMASAMAASPGGHMGSVFGTSAEREAAYRFVENSSIDPAELTRAARQAAVRRCFGSPLVFVPVDGTSLCLRDPTGRRGMGTVGTHGTGAQGLQVMSAIGVLPDGVPVGMLAQSYWARTKPVGLGKNDYDARPACERESRHWLDTITTVQDTFRDDGGPTRPFFQLDRGGDIASVLAFAFDHDVLLTARSTKSRCLTREGGPKRYLFNALRRVEPQGSYVIRVPEAEERRARNAVVQVQYAQVDLDVAVDRRNPARRRTIAAYAVRVVEVGSSPRGERPIEWVLLTTYPVHSVADACFVIDGYTCRWRIEKFHKTWKSGACRIEDTKLQSCENVLRFAVLSASVAMRIERLTHLARTTPEAPATDELSRHEIDATILLRKPAGVKPGQTPTIADVVRWIADVGGFMGPSQATIRKAQAEGRPVRQPGAQVIGRGLDRIEPVATLLATGTLKL